jgi:hypothetical protein
MPMITSLGAYRMDAVAQPPTTFWLTPRPYQYEAVTALLRVVGGSRPTRDRWRAGRIRGRWPTPPLEVHTPLPLLTDSLAKVLGTPEHSRLALYQDVHEIGPVSHANCREAPTVPDLLFNNNIRFKCTE